eukprot:10088751-Alexandrium_andersonii.AAC.1
MKGTGGPSSGASGSAPSRTRGPGGGTAMTTSGRPTSPPWPRARSTLSARPARRTAPSPSPRWTGTGPCSSA